MKQELKKTLGISLGIILALALMLLLIVFFTHRDNDEGLASVDKELKIVTQSYPTQFVVYGEVMDFDPLVSVKYIKEINQETLTKGEEYVYGLIIVNDLNGEVDLSDDEWRVISDLVQSNKYYNLFYLGNEDIEQLLRVGVISDLDMWNESDLSIGVTHEGEDIITVFGTYYKNAKFSLQEALIAEQVFSIKMSN